MNGRAPGQPAERITERLRAPVDGASLAILRIGLGVLIAVEALGYLAGDEIARAFLDPAFHFTYTGFSWVQPWPGFGLYLHFGVLVVLGMLVAAGVAHRFTAPLLTIGFAYVFLLEKAEYLNHFYAAILFLSLVAITPADRAFSVAARRNPERPRSVPTWAVWLLRFQVGVIYVYAGIAKLGDDWLAGEPMSTWLLDSADLPLVGDLVAGEHAGLVFSWAGAAYDLSIVPLLLWKRTRVFAFALVVAFNLTNWIIFDIGIFPPMMIVATTIFLEPGWPRGAAAWVRRRIGWATSPPPPADSRAPATAPPSRLAARLLVPLLAVYVAVQLLVPLRHHLYPGLVHWSEEGHRFAWHMKLRQKDGIATFFAFDPKTGERRVLATEDLISRHQLLRASYQPDMLVQLAQRLAERERALGSDVEVRVEAWISLNTRPARLLVDPEVDLGAVDYGLGPADWITPEPPP